MIESIFSALAYLHYYYYFFNWNFKAFQTKYQEKAYINFIMYQNNFRLTHLKKKLYSMNLR